MRYVEIFSDLDGVSHFRDAEINFHSAELPSRIDSISESDFTQAKAGFISVASGWDSGWHNSPGDGFAILVHGMVEIEVGTGEVRRFSKGDVWRSTDVSGHGHISRVVGEENAIVYMANFNSAENNP
jgi:hypothetical protein